MWPRATVSILGLVLKCNQPCRTPACQEAQAFCETPICLVHWDKPSPRELEWKDECEKAQLKRQRWAAASGHSLSAALLQTTHSNAACMTPLLAYDLEIRDGQMRQGEQAGMPDTSRRPCFHACSACVPLVPFLLSCLANIFPLTRQCTFCPSLGDLLAGHFCVSADRFI